MNDSASIPLCVDLDGTLVKLDTLHQALFLLLRRSPASIFRIPGWIAKGKAHLKDQVMQRITLAADALPYNQPFLAWLRKEHEAGRRLVLATASNYRTADAVAGHLGIFEETLSSSTDTNLRHKRKLAAIQERFTRFGYAGNDAADFSIWNAAEEIILVNPSRAARTKYTAKADHVFVDRRPLARMLLNAMRCHQWLKNLLVFTPMLLAHRFTEPDVLMQTAAAFVSFSLAASAIYVLNDLFDLSADQHHPRKCKRPFAAGDLSITAGALLIPLLAILSLVPCLFLPYAFFAALLSYYLVTTLYSWRLKQIPIVDALVLAVLYTMRIVAGSAASGTPSSGWFIGFSAFLFLSLAFVKRVSELREMADESDIAPSRRERGYKSGDLYPLLGSGVASGCLAVLVFTFYLGSQKVAALYSRPGLLWIFCALLLYWIARIWRLAWRNSIHDDPLAFATKDWQTWLLGALSLGVLLYAI